MLTIYIMFSCGYYILYVYHVYNDILHITQYDTRLIETETEHGIINNICAMFSCIYEYFNSYLHRVRASGMLFNNSSNICGIIWNNICLN